MCTQTKQVVNRTSSYSIGHFIELIFTESWPASYSQGLPQQWRWGQMGFLGFVVISLIVGPMLIISIKSFAPKLSKSPQTWSTWDLNQYRRWVHNSIHGRFCSSKDVDLPSGRLDARDPACWIIFSSISQWESKLTVSVKQKTGLIPYTCGSTVQGGDSSCIWNQNHKTQGKWSKCWEVFVLKQLYSIHNLYEWQMIMKHFSKVPTRFENSSPPQSTLQWCERSSKSSLQTGRDIKI